MEVVVLAVLGGCGCAGLCTLVAGYAALRKLCCPPKEAEPAAVQAIELGQASGGVEMVNSQEPSLPPHVIPAASASDASHVPVAAPLSQSALPLHCRTPPHCRP
eukprot:CAMPEP_0173430316 /NCGR_PEP_ID=MMETSP1357-20121228/8779_1 /TAXON_ID=77926 /ORGANISM="Hemiselmis rufescens, Strain PCC563" /LENGTH=103 /DNA_ID=CAMNT_0014394631 /DNA_START=178 /DNA_END=486 /DNA_ORIENTATION=-